MASRRDGGSVRGSLRQRRPHRRPSRARLVPLTTDHASCHLRREPLLQLYLARLCSLFYFGYGSYRGPCPKYPPLFLVRYTRNNPGLTTDDLGVGDVGGNEDSNN